MIYAEAFTIDDSAGHIAEIVRSFSGNMHSSDDDLNRK